MGLNSDKTSEVFCIIRIFGWMDSYAVLAAALVFIPSLCTLFSSKRNRC